MLRLNRAASGEPRTGLCVVAVAAGGERGLNGVAGTRDGKAAGPAEGRAAVRAAGCSDGWPRRGPPGPQHGSAPRLEAGSAGCHPVGECRQGCSPPGWRRSDRCPRGGSLGAAAARAGRTRLSARAGSAVPRARSPALGLPGSRGRACRRALEITFSFFFQTLECVW